MTQPISACAFSGGIGKAVLGWPESTGVASWFACGLFVQAPLEIASNALSASAIAGVDATVFGSIRFSGPLSRTAILHAPPVAATVGLALGLTRVGPRHFFTIQRLPITIHSYELSPN